MPQLLQYKTANKNKAPDLNLKLKADGLINFYFKPEVRTGLKQGLNEENNLGKGTRVSDLVVYSYYKKWKGRRILVWFAWFEECPSVLLMFNLHFTGRFTPYNSEILDLSLDSFTGSLQKSNSVPENLLQVSYAQREGNSREQYLEQGRFYTLVVLIY